MAVAEVGEQGEAAVLRALAPTSAAAPGLVGADPDGQRCGAPSVVMELMPGTRVVPGDLRVLAGELARAMATIHDVSPPAIDGLPDATERGLRALSKDHFEPNGYSSSTTVWSFLRNLPVPSSTGPRTLLHNYFAQHQTLFIGNRLSAVLDWTDAATGQPAWEVCFCRLNVALVWGLDAGDMVLEAYEAQTGASLPDRGWYDLAAAARVEPDLDGRTESANYLGPRDVTVHDVTDRFNRFVTRAQTTI